MIDRLLLPTAIIAVLLTGVIFGFFYAWVCSTMWGLDNADPKVAIAAMQAMNASVRNQVFALTFFLTPAALWLVAGMSFNIERKNSAYLFGAAGVIYLLFGLVLTISINVPMNNAFALVSIPESSGEAEILWNAYSQKWQLWNVVRTVFSGVALVLASMGLYRLGVETAQRARLKSY